VIKLTLLSSLIATKINPLAKLPAGGVVSLSKLSDALNGPLADTVTGCVMPTEIVPHTDCTVSDVRAADGIGIDHDPMESYALSGKRLATDGQKSVNCVSHCRVPLSFCRSFWPAGEVASGRCRVKYYQR